MYQGDPVVEVWEADYTTKNICAEHRALFSFFLFFSLPLSFMVSLVMFRDESC
jgi:hypothetical protein